MRQWRVVRRATVDGGLARVRIKGRTGRRVIKGDMAEVGQEASRAGKQSFSDQHSAIGSHAVKSGLLPQTARHTCLAGERTGSG